MQNTHCDRSPIFVLKFDFVKNSNQFLKNLLLELMDKNDFLPQCVNTLIFLQFVLILCVCMNNLLFLDNNKNYLIFETVADF